MGASNMPAADVVIDEVLVRRLLRSQHPDLAELSLTRFANGWDNVMYRLGGELVVRLPRREPAAVLVEHEQSVLPLLGPQLPLPVPVPVRSGRPDDSFPYAWSVLPWFDGQPLGATPLRAPALQAARLGEFLGSLHVEAPADAPPNPFRGQFIGDKDEIVRGRLASIEALLDTELPGGAGEVLRRWEQLVEVEPFAAAPTWLHGDLHALNLVERDGRVVAVVDWGDVCAGDPACDLAVAWALFGPGERAELRRGARVHGEPVDCAMWQRAEAWALYFCIAYLANSADDPAMLGVGRRSVRHLFGD